MREKRERTLRRELFASDCSFPVRLKDKRKRKRKTKREREERKRREREKEP